MKYSAASTEGTQRQLGAGCFLRALRAQPGPQRPWPAGTAPTAMNCCRCGCGRPILHGKNGEDGTIQGLLELAAIPMWAALLWHPLPDKAVANTIMDAYHVPHCHWCSAVRAKRKPSAAPC